MDKIYEREKLFNKYRKSKVESKKQLIYEEYKRTRYLVTDMKRDAKIKYTRNILKHKSKASYIWKGVKSIVKLSTSSKKD